MKSRLIKVFASLVLVVLAVFLVVPNFSHISAAEGDTYQLVTDASTLKVNDKIIIVATKYDVALSTTQNKNNRAQATIEKSTDNETITFTADSGVQVITLETGKVDRTFAFNVGNSYLYAASSSSNWLRTQDSIDGNASWTISIDKGVATIKAQGKNTRNLLKYNSAETNGQLFSCYKSGQADVSIYKLVKNTCAHTNTTDVPEVPATCTNAGTTAGVKCADCGKVMSGCEKNSG